MRLDHETQTRTSSSAHSRARGSGLPGNRGLLDLKQSRSRVRRDPLVPHADGPAGQMSGMRQIGADRRR
jgi:hypothetical protein